MPKKPRIFVDLDNCLIHSRFLASGAKVRGKLLSHELSNGDKFVRVPGELYASRLRPGALEFLSKCRGVARVTLLTTAKRCYAREHNKIFGLGFAPSDIIAREDYTMTICLPYGGSDILLLKDRQFPDSVLVDDGEVHHVHTSRKLRFLGIAADRFFHVLEFDGFPDTHAPIKKSVFNAICRKLQHGKTRQKN